MFPFSQAYRISLKNMKTHVPSSEYDGSADAPLPPPVPVIADNGRPIPFVPHAGEEDDDDPEEELPDFRILRSRVVHYGPTKGCPACKKIIENKKADGVAHTRACRRKLYTNLRADSWAIKDHQLWRLLLEAPTNTKPLHMSLMSLRRLETIWLRKLL